MLYTTSFSKLVDVFRKMPGVGSKSAVRMAYHILSLSDEETMQIIRSGRGEALFCANKNKVCIDIKASPLMYDLITTKRSDLEKRKNNF